MVRVISIAYRFLLRARQKQITNVFFFFALLYGLLLTCERGVRSATLSKKQRKEEIHIRSYSRFVFSVDFKGIDEINKSNNMRANCHYLKETCG